jgi:hypothetical protein
MRRSILAATIVAASLIGTAALAANSTDTSAIKAISSSKHTLTLADGKTFYLPKTWKSTGFKVGDKVTVTYELQNKKMMASEVTHAA